MPLEIAQLVVGHPLEILSERAIEDEPLTGSVVAAAALILTAVVLVGRGAPPETAPTLRTDESR